MGPKAIVVGTPRKVSFGLEPWNRRTTGPVWTPQGGLRASRAPYFVPAATASPFDGATLQKTSVHNRNNQNKYGKMGRWADCWTGVS